MLYAEPTSAGEQVSSLTPGQILASRYRIHGFLGQGAVGEVYEAEDLELGGRVAVKVLRSDLAQDERVVRRFKQEIQLTHRVTHPNVCRTYDLVYHQKPGQPVRVFLTMELLHGETLEALLSRQGRLAPSEALPIVRQIAAALRAAHAAGVIHRDLKSSNVFLVASPSGVRAVVNDFGLAWSEEAEGAATLTATGELIGSPAYMAPEQVRGETATSATDIYAFGVVLFEMVTGELPFLGKSAFYTALKRLQEPPPPPRDRVPGLDPVWDGVILRCLEREPADRFATVDEVVSALTGEAAPPLRKTEATPPPPRLRLFGVAAFLALLAILALGVRVEPQVPFAPSGALSEPSQEIATSLRRPQRRPGVAVLGFENLSGDPRRDYLGTVLLQMLPTELAAAPELRTIPVDEVERARQDLALGVSPRLSRESLSRVHALLGADFVVTGAYLVTGGGEMRFDVLVQDARTGATVTQLKRSGTEEDFLATLTALGAELRARLGAAQDLPAEALRAAHAGLPGTVEVLRLYTEGLAQLRLSEGARAIELLEKATELEPQNPLLHAGLAEAWWELGYRGRARDAARDAVERAPKLRAAERKWIEARWREMSSDWQAAAVLYGQLAREEPDNLEVGLRLAAVQTTAGQDDAAEATLGRLRKLPEPQGQDPRIYLAEAGLAHYRGDSRDQLAAAREAACRGIELNARIVVAQARLQEGLAQQRLGNAEEARDRFFRAEGFFSEANHPRGVAEALRARGQILAEQGDRAGAGKLFQHALAIYREIGDEAGAAAASRQLDGAG
jgi:eukaryotic-like serine/threonine-protein kinase